MLARERVVGAELREYRDHHAADEVPARAVLLAREGLLKPLERRRRVARSPTPRRRARAPRRHPARPARRGRRPRSRPWRPRAPPRPRRCRRAAGAACPARAVPWRARGPARARAAASPRPRRPRARRPRDGTSASKKRSTSAGGSAPVNSAATRPSRNALTAGIPWMRNAAWSRWLASTSTLASSTLPARSFAARSSTGVSCLQGAHHAAQKSTTTGTSRERSTTRCSKSASPTSKTVPFA